MRWESHEIVGKNSYLTPWIQITKFATDISKRISDRFPATEFLQALNMIDPYTWKASQDERYNSGI